VSETAVGRAPGVGSFQMYVDAVLGSLDDAGLSSRDVDVLVTSNSRTDPRLYHADSVAEYIGIRPETCYTLQTGGATTIGALKHVIALIAAGIARVAVIAAADNLATGMATNAAMASMGEGAHPDYEHPLGTTIPALYALLASRHMHEFGTTRRQMAAVAVAARRHAVLNDHASPTQQLTIDDVLSAPPIAAPFHRHDCALISDGGGAIVVVARELCADLPHPPVSVLGAGEARGWSHITASDSLVSTAAVESAAIAFDMAGVSHTEIDFATVYDAFTILPIILLEDLGFCAKGEGGPFVEDGRIALGGALPINTHGGLLSHAHPGRSGAMLGLVEAAVQLRGAAGRRQVPDASIGLVHAEGGIASCHGTAILGTAD
jgi:acetyl-CoA acetyltransferase